MFATSTRVVGVTIVFVSLFGYISYRVWIGFCCCKITLVLIVVNAMPAMIAAIPIVIFLNIVLSGEFLLLINLCGEYYKYPL